jgi:hypothetical protein
MGLDAARTAPGRDTIRLVSKRRTPAVEPPEPRAPMSPAQIATAAYSLAILQAHDDIAGDVAAVDAAIYETLSLLALECLAMLCGRDPNGFGYLLNGLGIYADMRRAECWAAARVGQPPSPLGQVVTPVNVH